jgi:hypothetical protein
MRSSMDLPRQRIVESLAPQFARTLRPGMDTNIRESLTPTLGAAGVAAADVAGGR